MNSQEIYVLASLDLILAFKFVGLQGNSPQSKEDAIAVFETLCKPSSLVKMVIIDDTIAIMLGNRLSTHELKGNYPLVVEIPGITGAMPGKPTLLDTIREAVGVSI